MIPSPVVALTDEGILVILGLEPELCALSWSRASRRTGDGSRLRIGGCGCRQLRGYE